MRGRSICAVVGGGDGTINAAAFGVIEAGLPLGILPMGTANDLARTLGIPSDIDGAARFIADGNTRRIDLGLVNGEPFFNVASLGLSAELAQKLTRDIKRRFGRLGYALVALNVLAHARPFRATIASETETVHVSHAADRGRQRALSTAAAMRSRRMRPSTTSISISTAWNWSAPGSSP